MICNGGEVVVVPFPFVDHPIVTLRPALVLSSQSFNGDEGQTLLAMITTAARSRWRSDCEITDLASAGLKTRSVVRLKVFTVENTRIARRIGRLAGVDLASISARLGSVLLRSEPTSSSAGP